VPIDAPVELVHPGDDEPFLADVVNLGLGGLSMRATFLPDVGERLACSFEAQPGREIKANVEVVWVADKRGEFGLRFVDLDEGQKRTVREIVAGFYRPPKPAAVVKPEPERIRVQLDGVKTPVVATVIDRCQRSMTVEQALPFLKLETGIVDEQGRRGRIVAVDLSVEGDTPKLLLDLAFDETTLPDPPPADATAPRSGAGSAQPSDGECGPGESYSMGRGGAAPSERTVPDFESVDDDEVSEVRSVTPSSAGAIDMAPMPSEPVVRVERPQVEPAKVEVERVAAVAAPERPERGDQSVRIVQHEVVKVEREVEIEIDPELRPSLARAFTSLPFDRQRITAFYAKVKPYLAIAWTYVSDAWAKAMEIGGAILEKASPRLKRMSSGAIAFTRAKLGRARARRTTAPPPKDSNIAPRIKAAKARGQQKEEPLHRRKIGRYVLVALLAIAAVLVLLYAFQEEPEIATPPPVSVPERVIESIDLEPPPAAITAPVIEAPPAPDPEAGDVAPAPEAEPEAAEREPGPMPAPTFPSVSGAPLPQTVPSDSPYAVDVAQQPSAPMESGPSFGAESVSNGESYSLRMSQPVRAVAGRATSNGFVVEIQGALSLDRAGPIARNHPLVERAVILNMGDRAELTIEFSEGASPAYRVVPRGAAVEVTIARR
jgi:hypothetical protein